VNELQGWVDVFGKLGVGGFLHYLASRAVWVLATRALELWFKDRQDRRQIEAQQRDAIEHALQARYAQIFHEHEKQVEYLVGEVKRLSGVRAECATCVHFPGQHT
jgi:hypothetical protein